MEAPTIKDIKTKNFDFKFENKNYILTLSYNDNIIININCLNENKIYENNFSFEQFSQINKFFLMCESIKDIFDELSNLINDNISLNFSDNILILKISIPSKKNKEANFTLYSDKKPTEEINNLSQQFIRHEKIITEQNLKIIKQEEDIKYLKEKIFNLENKINFFESLINKSEDKSEIFSQDEKIKKLKKIIGRKCNLKLLYQMSKDGSSCSVFHDKVDNKGPTITLFETEDGYKFGGYTSQSFDQSEYWIKDSDSFLFNFINLNKFPIKNKSSDAIYLGNKNEYGPEFYDILVNSSDIKISQIRVENYIYKQEDLKGGNALFNNKEVSVYQVDFI